MNHLLKYPILSYHNRTETKAWNFSLSLRSFVAVKIWLGKTEQHRIWWRWNRRGRRWTRGGNRSQREEGRGWTEVLGMVVDGEGDRRWAAVMDVGGEGWWPTAMVVEDRRRLWTVGEREEMGMWGRRDECEGGDEWVLVFVLCFFFFWNKCAMAQKLGHGTICHLNWQGISMLRPRIWAVAWYFSATSLG